MFNVKKTLIMFDENNYLIYINHSLLKEKGKDYQKEKRYIKRFVDEYWRATFCNPDHLKDADKIEILKQVFELDNLEII